MYLSILPFMDIWVVSKLELLEQFYSVYLFYFIYILFIRTVLFLFILKIIFMILSKSVHFSWVYHV